jgi:hypothetical protein
MNEEAGIKDGTGTDEGTGMDARGAAVILQEAGECARRELCVRRPVLFASGGLALLLGYGAIWLSVRGQRPYHGPTPAAALVLVLLLGAAGVITASVIEQAAEGVSGLSALRRRIYLLSLATGYAGVITMEAALDHAGASRPVVFGVFAAAAPILVTGAIYIANSAASLDWPMCGLGAWLVVVAVSSAFAGPVAAWAVASLAGGSGYLAVAAIQRWLPHS